MFGLWLECHSRNPIYLARLPAKQKTRTQLISSKSILSMYHQRKLLCLRRKTKMDSSWYALLEAHGSQTHLGGYASRVPVGPDPPFPLCGEAAHRRVFPR